jgi:F1F0 ATPase subunit 2
MTEPFADPAGLSALAAPLALGAAAGAGLGLLLYGGLWWTVRRLATARRPGAALALSTVLRLGLVALALAGLARIEPAALAGAVVGLIAVRLVLIRRLAPAPRPPAAAGD